MPKPIDIVLPEETEGSVARLERWLVEPGTTVAADDAVVEIETDKVTFEVSAGAAGVLREALVQPGEEVTPGTVLGRIEPGSGGTDEHPAVESAAIEIRFPADQLEGTAATLSRWLIAPGERASEGQPVAEIETDKVTVEVAAPVAGVLATIAVSAGDALEPGALLGTLQPAAAPASVGDPPAPEAPAVPAQVAPAEAGERVSPAVRRLMSEHGLESLEGIRGSGRGGRVRRDDLLSWLGQRPAAAAAGSGIPGRMVAHSNMRRAIARHMAESVREAPHVTAVFEADLAAVVRHRRAHRAEFEAQGVKLTYTAYFMAAAARAMAVVPEVNARFHADALEIFDEVNIGVGTALGDRGLIVPVVRGVERLDLLGIARELHDRAERARAGTLTPEDLKHGTFTISNHGVSGSLLAAPIIINQPQVAILGVGKLEKRLQVYECDGEDKVRIRPMCYVTLTIDHRALDAHQTNRWLTACVQTLETWPSNGH